MFAIFCQFDRCMDFLTGFYDGSDPVSAAAGGVSNRAQVFKRTDRERDAAVGNRNLIDPAGGLPKMEHDHLMYEQLISYIKVDYAPISVMTT